MRERFFTGVARQLGHPQGLVGHLVARMLNRGNRRSVTAAVDALTPPRGAAVADVGFGGGVGLPILLERVGEQGSVHGIEISSEMLDRAARRFERETSESRLSLHKGSMTELPLGDASLDGVITTNTVYFVADLEAAFRELARVLKPSGRAVVGVGDPEAMAKMPVSTYGFRLRPIHEIGAAARGAGLALQDDRRVGHGPRASTSSSSSRSAERTFSSRPRRRSADPQRRARARAR